MATTKIEAVTLLVQHFQLDAPVTPTAFRERYRQLVRELHPDVAGAETTEQFQIMQDAYDKIQTVSSLFIIYEENRDGPIAQYKRNAMTQEGIPLTNLGLGFGPNVNAVDCEYCNGKGYTSSFGYRKVYCNECDEEGRALQTCPQCRGSKGFTSIDGHTHVKCQTCNDAGVVLQQPRKSGSWSYLDDLFGHVLCSKCRGTKFREIRDKECYTYHKCHSCQGKGEIRIYNPVIMKGRLGK